MRDFEPVDRNEWFETLARSTKIRALGCVDEPVRATLLDVAETYSRLAARGAHHCFCGREATRYHYSRGERLGLCHLHAAAWETPAEQVGEDGEPQSSMLGTKAWVKDNSAVMRSFVATTIR